MHSRCLWRGIIKWNKFKTTSLNHSNSINIYEDCKISRIYWISFLLFIKLIKSHWNCIEWRFSFKIVISQHSKSNWHKILVILHKKLNYDLRLSVFDQKFQIVTKIIVLWTALTTQFSISLTEAFFPNFLHLFKLLSLICSCPKNY